MGDLINRLDTITKSDCAETVAKVCKDTIERLTRRVDALESALDTENAAATRYAQQVAHWVEKYDALKEQLDAMRKQEPIAWVRRHPDGTLTAGTLTAEFLEDAVIEPIRKKSGAWKPLFLQAKEVSK